MAEAGAGAKAGAGGAAEADVLDLRGMICPVTWARTKYALQMLAPGAELKVVLDHRPAVPDIKRNVEDLGQDVLAARELADGVWEMVLRRV
ncbi:MAG TPA: sulfurtransferase TusA family protein [Myxococcales bacterium]|nr:sulfurtransferase TusA family protein [Myxococcales bacterium]